MYKSAGARNNELPPVERYRVVVKITTHRTDIGLEATVTRLSKGQVRHIGLERYRSHGCSARAVIEAGARLH